MMTHVAAMRISGDTKKYYDPIHNRSYFAGLEKGNVIVDRVSDMLQEVFGASVSNGSYSFVMDVAVQLQNLESKNRNIMAPAIFFLGLMGPIALIGNIVVFVVYNKRFKESATRTFILTVAVFDLLCTVLALPIEVFSMLHSVAFPSPILCKCYVFIEQFSASGSAASLVLFAFHRYRKICRPLKNQMSVSIARSLRLCVFVFAVGITWPDFILYGDRTTLTPDDGLVARSCGIQDYFKQSVFTYMYRCFFLIIFLFGAVGILIVYILVIKKVLLLRRCKCKSALPYQRVMREMMRTVKLRSLSESSNSSHKVTRVSAASLRHSKTQSKMFTTPKRTTLMIAIATLVIVISFLPNLVLRVVEEFHPRFVDDLTSTELAVYHVFVRFYYLHCAANPIIYSALSTKFRAEFFDLMRGRSKKDIINRRRQCISQMYMKNM